ncbi:hypothetical protein ACI78V_22120 [Geodermatophilus sp. SYSU D00742]
MYSWIWRHLPGGTGVRAVTALVLALAVAALLLFVVFPAVSEHVELWTPTL